MRRVAFIGVCAAIMTSAVADAACGYGFATQPDGPAEAASVNAAGVEQALRLYAETFNKHDASATAALWSPAGCHEDRDSGLRLEGREAIETDLAVLFRKRPDIQLAIHADRVRFVHQDVAKVDGRAMVSVSGEDLRVTHFSAIFTREQGQWLLDSAEETAAATTTAAGAALEELEWLVGTWQDQSDDAHVETTIRWARGGSFLIWAYTVQIPNEDKPREGTEVIAWDPRSRQIRSWTFESDGSFGEGTWSHSGDEWLLRLSYVSGNGELTTATQVISKIDNNQFKTQIVGLEVDGTPMRSLEPVLVVRVSASEPLERDRR